MTLTERDSDYESRFLTKDQLIELDEIIEDFNNGSFIYSPNSVYHGMKVHDPNRMPFPNETLLKIEIGRLTDFIEFLFSDREYCDHVTEREAWDEFNQFEYSKITKTP